MGGRHDVRVDWSGLVSVAFVIDAFARRIMGRCARTSMSSPLVLDALEQALWTRTHSGATDLTGGVHHIDRGPSQYTSIRFPERLAEAGIAASVGTVSDSYDNAPSQKPSTAYPRPN